jgi:transcriptional regulator with XRE-family HTH domain
MSEVVVEGQAPAWTLTDRLRKAREYRGLEQTELADLMGVSRRTVVNYEAGRTTPRRPQLIAWAFATGVSFQWLERDAESPRDGVDGGSADQCAVRDSNPEPADSRFAPVHVLHGSTFSPSSEALDDLATTA